MSYILSALKTAEQQRRGDRGSPVTLAVPASPAPARGGPVAGYRGWVMIVAAILAVAFGAYGLLPQGQGADAGGSSADPAAREPVNAAVAPAQPGPAVAVTPAQPLFRQRPVEAPPLNVTGYIFVENNPAASKLFVDGVVHRLGSSPMAGMKIVEFHRDMVVADYRGVRQEIWVD